MFCFDFKEILPENYPYCVSDFQTEGTGFTASLKVGAKDVDAAKEWLKDFQQTSKTTWRVMRTCPMGGKYVIFKVDYNHHGFGMEVASSSSSWADMQKKKNECLCNKCDFFLIGLVRQKSYYLDLFIYLKHISCGN